jgi:Protein of unknown function (DUF3106)
MMDASGIRFSKLAATFAAFLIFLGFSGLLPTFAYAEDKPAWTELTEQQRNALSPLAPEWKSLDGPRKHKWLEIAAKFPTMKPDEQQRAQARMREFAALTPEQRKQVRENYRAAQSVPREQREAQWQQYQSLPQERKDAIQAKAKEDEAKKKPPGALPQADAVKK